MPYYLAQNSVQLMDQARQAELDVHDVVNMQYTSGTTGFPKGVMLTHHNIGTNGYWIGENQNFTHQDRVCIPVPLFHCFGCVLGVLAAVTHAATMVLLETFDPVAVMASVEEERCTALYGVPTMFIAVLQHKLPDRVPLEWRATTEVDEMLMRHFGCSLNEAFDRLHVDRVIDVGPTYAGPPIEPGYDMYGCRHRLIDYGTGAYDEVVSHPLARYTSVDEIEAEIAGPPPVQLPKGSADDALRELRAPATDATGATTSPLSASMAGASARAATRASTSNSTGSTSSRRPLRISVLAR